MNRAHIGLSGLIILCSITLLGCQKEKTVNQDIPLVMVTKPSSSVQAQHSYAGQVEARQQTALSFRVAGQITERDVDVGDRVRAGQVLAKLDVKDAQLQLNAAQAQFDNASAAAQVASDELKRYQQLLPINAVSRSQFDAIKNQYTAAQASLKQARSNLDVAANQTRYNQLRATQAGVITAREIEIGQVVSAGQTVYQLAIDGDREVVIGVPEQLISTLKIGQSASVRLWSSSENVYPAYVREISPAADATRTFRVKVAFSQAQPSIQLGQSARVFLSEPTQTSLSVPLSSVSATHQQPYVWVVQANHTLKKVPVRLGDYGREQVSILSGLQPSDWVVVGGVHLLREQQKIRPIDRNNRAVNLQARAAS
ncbi:efflux RND transporter periplasmic adaptor subunit [Acinetobacter soli]|uniref:efflux RND transporter periplasmic adaptor subunit n=1 Tax=Acinetobacter soli TaxID=487316 RepID=UPI003019B389